MSYLVKQLPAWIVVLILTVSTIVLVLEIKKQKGYMAKVLSLLIIPFICGITYAITSNIPTVPQSVNWTLIIFTVLFIFAFLVYGFIGVYKSILEPGATRRNITIAFCVFMGYLVFLAVGITIKVLSEK